MAMAGPIGRAIICFNFVKLSAIPKKTRKIANKISLLYPNGPSSTWTLNFSPKICNVFLLTIFRTELCGANVSVELDGGGDGGGGVACIYDKFI